MLPNNKNSRILCVGICVLDIIQVCEFYPIEDSKKRSIHGRWQRGGSASIICTVLAQCNVCTEFLGILPTGNAVDDAVLDDFNIRQIIISNCLYQDYEIPISSVFTNQITGSSTIISSSNAKQPIFSAYHFKRLNLYDYRWIHFEKMLPHDDDDKYILCVGMCVLDIIQVCSTYPEEDSDKRSKYGRWQRGGNASNNCTVLAQFGVKSEFLGSLSAAKMFKFVIDDCLDRGIRITNCISHNSEAPLSSVILNEATGSRTIIHSNPNLPILTFDVFNRIDMSQYKWIHFEGRNPEETFQMMEHCINYNNTHLSTENKITISVELEKLRPEILDLCIYADIIFLGRDFADFLGYSDKKTAVYEIRKKIQRKSNTIICTWGSAGVAALDDTDQYYSSDSFPPDKIVDSLGAGDTFVAATIYAICCQKLALNKAITFASHIAGAKVGFYGYDDIGKIYKSFLLDD